MKDNTYNQTSSKANSNETNQKNCKEKSSSYYENAEPLPESFRPRKDGPGGN